MWMARTLSLLTSIRADCPVEPDGRAEGGDQEDDQQQEDERRPVRKDHKGRIRSVNALPGDTIHIILNFRDSDKIRLSFEQVVPHLIWVNLG